MSYPSTHECPRALAYARSVISTLIATVSTVGFASAQQLVPSADPEQLARSIAATIEATTPSASSDSPISQKASSHENIVEVHTFLNNDSAFANISANRISYKQGIISFYCKPERVKYMQKGVVFHYVVAGPGGSGSFDFSIDDRVCASSAHPSGSNSLVTTKAAQELAQQVALILSREPSTGGLRYEGTHVQGDEIYINEIIDSPELFDRISKQDYQFRGITTGWFCGKFGREIGSGIRMHIIYKTHSGQTGTNIPVDKSVC